MWREALAIGMVALATTTHAFVIGPQQHHGMLPADARLLPQTATTTTASSRTTRLYASSNSKPFAVVVKAEIDPDRMHEFLEMIETNAVETRKEPGCLRFDVLRSQDNPAEFFFYELYSDESAIDYHKQQPHYNMWTKFKESGGTVSSTSYKTDGEFLT